MRRLLSILFCLCVLAPACAQTNRNVRLHGTTDGFGSGDLTMNPAGMAGDISDMNAYTIPVGKDGTFDMTIQLDKPTYFKIGRNYLYLTPGDDMEAHINRSERKSHYKGRGEVANNYLTGMVYPQNGGFMMTGRNVKEDFESTEKYMMELYEKRLAELNALNGVTDEFKDMERMRLRADIAESYLGYLSYSDILQNGMDLKEAERLAMEYYRSIAPKINAIVREISVDEKYLELTSVRDIIFTAVDSEGMFEAPELSQRAQEYGFVGSKEGVFEGDITPELYKELESDMAALKNRDFADAFMYRLDKFAKLMVGRPAIDLDITLPDGTAAKMSDFKGNVIYVDFWATWCGPCMGEAPYYEELSKKYPGVVFLSLSIDSNRGAWESHVSRGEHGNVKNYHCTDPRVGSGWDVTGIPRFLLIDRDFNIISANAPRPSDSKVIEPLLGELQK